jgi:hypothetical protein
MTESIERPTPDEADDAARAGTPAAEVAQAGTAPARPDADAARDAVIAEAVGVIDQALGHMLSRELVSSGEVADLLLDLRTALTAAPSRV